MKLEKKDEKKKMLVWPLNGRNILKFKYHKFENTE